MFAKWIRGKASATRFASPINSIVVAWNRAEVEVPTWRELIVRALHVPSNIWPRAESTQWTTEASTNSKHQTQYAIYNDSTFAGSANTTFSRLAREKKIWFFAIIRMQRLNESWKWAESVPLSAFMYAIQPQPEWRSGSAHICGHISNKAKKWKSVSCAAAADATPFGNCLCARARHKTETYTWNGTSEFG